MAPLCGSITTTVPLSALAALTAWPAPARSPLDVALIVVRMLEPSTASRWMDWRWGSVHLAPAW